jgi:pyruvate,orthophosphate dikinase
METRERDAQHLKFVVEQGRLWVVAARSAKRSARAAVRIVRDMVAEGLISAEEARDRLGAVAWGTAVITDLDPEAAERARAAGRCLAQGTGVSPGAAVGAAAFDTATARSYAETGRAYVLIVARTVPNDVPDVLAAEGLIMQAARPFTNGAFMCQGNNIPAVAYVPDMTLDPAAGTARVGDRVIHTGDVLTLDGLTGDIFLGPVPLTPSPALQILTDLWPSSARDMP